jgi:2-keto-4-pentenoate hydratase/2-oxohepta-3-ene-1,7-dioic acid hydratase in catechol pathway
MRLVSYLEGGSDRLGVERDGRVLSVEHLVSNGPRTMAAMLDEGPGMLARLRLADDAPWPDTGMSLDDLTLLSPVPNPGKIIAVAVNYQDHAAEGGRAAPAEPVLFAKFSTALLGHRGEISWDPRLTSAVDYEAELAVVMGKVTRNVKPEEALGSVLGYTCLNDVSARDLQFADKQFVRAKSLDTFCPTGPALVTADAIDDPQALAIRCLVNGEVRQEASTGDMVHGVAELISFCSRSFTLLPGDIIATGTPSGVGWYRSPRQMLADGDEVVVEVEGIGRLVNRCRELTD